MVVHSVLHSGKALKILWYLKQHTDRQTDRRAHTHIHTYTITLEGKHIITYFECKDRNVCNIVNLFIFFGMFQGMFTNKKCSKSRPCFKLFQIEIDIFLESLKLVTNPL